jgi:hypothetical protein
MRCAERTSPVVRSVTVMRWSSASARTRLAGAAEAHLAGVVEAVVAQPVVAWRVSVAGWECFGCGAVGVAWCASVKRAVRALLVVVRCELVELALQRRDAARGWSGA